MIKDFYFSYIKTKWGTLVLLFAIEVLLWITGLTVPFVTGKYIDKLLESIGPNEIVLMVVLIAGLSLFQALISFARRIVNIRYVSEIAHDVTGSLLSKMVSSEYRLIEADNASRLSDQIAKDSQTMAGFFISSLPQTVINAFTILFSVFILYRIDARLCLMATLLLLVYYLTAQRNKKKIYSAHEQRQRASFRYFAKLFEQIDRLLFIRQNSIWTEMRGRFGAAHLDYKKTAVQSACVDFMFSNMNYLVVLVIYSCVIGFGGYQVAQGSLSIGIFSVLNIYFQKLLGSVSFYVGLTTALQDARAAYTRIMTILNLPNQHQGEERIKSVERVDVQEFSLVFPGRILIQDFSYVFEKGKIYGIVGGNGSGKSTLLNSLIGIHKGETKGDILYNGIDINSIDMESVKRGRVAFLSQPVGMIDMKANEYLRLGVDKSVSMARNLFSLSCTAGEVEINENLSGGERQKIALSRVLLKGADLMILDEPTTALDAVSCRLLIEYLTSIKSRHIIVASTHDEQFIEACDEIIKL